MIVLVTGASGFVGSQLLYSLILDQIDVVASSRTGAGVSVKQRVHAKPLEANTDWTEELSGATHVIHCAARAHVMDESEADPLSIYRQVNTEATLNLAEQAAKAGVQRFIFISSIKVNGESTEPDKPFSPEDSFIPTDPYGISKFEAEQGLRKIAKQTGMEVVIIRPPLAYGPGVKANFASLISLVIKQIPLPLKSLRNQRSFIGIDNLVDFIKLCLTHPKAANQTFLISDDRDVSTPELISIIAQAFNKNARLFWFPMPLLKFALMLIGKSKQFDRLAGSLTVDISKAKTLLNWKPVRTMEQQMADTAKAYYDEKTI
jgi:nucleoside-diphosphate-sugar epimerase